MYRVITYKSKPLKERTIYYEWDYSSSDIDEEEFDEEPEEQRSSGEVTYIIDGVEVSEEDLTFDERLDIEANTLLNQDGFYTPLLPLDAYQETKKEERKSGNVIKIILIAGSTAVLLAGVVVAMIMLL